MVCVDEYTQLFVSVYVYVNEYVPAVHGLPLLALYLGSKHVAPEHELNHPLGENDPPGGDCAIATVPLRSVPAGQYGESLPNREFNVTVVTGYTVIVSVAVAVHVPLLPNVWFHWYANV
jgi:hypothetical protein